VIKLRRRDLVKFGAAVFASACAAPRLAWSQSYPARAVRILVGFPPGASPDLTARLVGQWLSERLGQPVIIENRPGAATNIATEAVAYAPADGHTLLWVTAANASNLMLVDAASFNFIRDIVPVARAVEVPNVMEVHTPVSRG
jgi:tripartite-type tricarboxylate transporter receptor subunit TctC